jgi:RNA polymerase sigma-70 factor (ECF subfamily)
LKAYQNLTTFREDSKFSTWLIRITVNQSLTKLRKQRATRELSPDEDLQAENDTLPIEVPTGLRIRNSSTGRLNCETS